MSEITGWSDITPARVQAHNWKRIPADSPGQSWLFLHMASALMVLQCNLIITAPNHRMESQHQHGALTQHPDDPSLGPFQAHGHLPCMTYAEFTHSCHLRPPPWPTSGRLRTCPESSSAAHSPPKLPFYTDERQSGRRGNPEHMAAPSEVCPEACCLFHTHVTLSALLEQLTLAVLVIVPCMFLWNTGMCCMQQP